MALPVVASVTPTVFNSDASTHNCAIPATVNAGDLLILVWAQSLTNAITTPSGWTVLCASTATSDSGGRGAVYGKLADGSEAGGTVNVATSGNVRGAASHVIRITGWFGTIATGIAAGTPATGASANPDPPSTTWAWGTSDVLAIACGHAMSGSDRVFSGFPSSYTGGTYSAGNSGAGGFDTAMVATAFRSISGGSSPENPGTFTVGTSVGWLANTIIVRPSANVDLTRDITGASITHSATVGRVKAAPRTGTFASITNTATVARVQRSVRAVVSSIAHTATVARALVLVRSLASTVAHAAAVARALAVSRLIVSSIAHTAVVDRVAGKSRDIASSIDHSVVVDRILGALRDIASSIDHTSEATRVVTVTRSVASSVAHSMAIERAVVVTRSISASIAHTAIVERLTGFTRELASEIEHSATVAAVAGYVRTILSTIAFGVDVSAETASLLNRTIASSIAHSATVARQVVATRDISSSIAHASTVARDGSAFIRGLTSSVAHAVAVERAIVQVRTIASTIDHTAAVERALALVRDIASTIPHSTAILRTIFSGTVYPLRGRASDSAPNDASSYDSPLLSASATDTEGVLTGIGSEVD